MITTKIDIKPHLKEYIIGKFNHSADTPVVLPATTDLYHVIFDLTIKRPVNVPVDRGNLVVVLPCREIGKRPEVYNYISDRGCTILERHIESMFWADLHQMLDENKHLEGIEYIHTAYYFLSKYSIESISPDALIKHYYRWREKIRRRKQKRFYTKKNGK